MSGHQHLQPTSSSTESVILGRPPHNFWLYDPSTKAYDLTHPPTPTSSPVQPRLSVATATNSSITIDPAKTTLVVIDMQNFFLSPALGKNPNSKGSQAEKVLLDLALPAARTAGIQIAWLNWGLSEEDLDSMSPTAFRGFGMSEIDKEGESGGGEVAKDCGLGEEMGKAMVEGGREVDMGKKLMKGSWNTQMTPRLMEEYESTLKTKKPDKWLFKDRLSGLWHKETMAMRWFREQGMRTLLFAGVNTDQCVLSTLQDASHHGFDCVLLRDACGTTSPDSAREAAEWNCRKVWGFQTSCEDFAEGVDNMEKK